MSLKQKTISGVIWTASQQFGIVGIRFFAQILLARIISPSDFGLFGLIIIFNAIGNTISESGMGQSLIRSNKLTEKDYGTVFLLNLFVSIFIYFIIFLSAPFIADWYEKPILTSLIRVYSIAIILTSFSSIQIHRLTKLLKFKEQTIVQIPSVLISALVGIVMGYLGYGVWALVWMEIIMIFLIAVQFWIFTNWRPKFIFDYHVFQHHFNFGYKLLLSGLLDSIMKNIYPMVIGKYNPIQQVGFYTRASTLKNVPVNTIMSALGRVTYPVLAEVKNDKKRLKDIYQKMLQVALFAIAPMMLLFIVIAEPLFIFLITDVWLPAVPYFQLLCFTGILYPLHVYNLNILKVQGRSDLFLKAEVYKKIVGISILVITAPFGIFIMIYGILLSNIIGLLINQYFSSKVLNYSNKEQSLDSLKIIWPAILAGSLLYYLNQFLKYDAMNIYYLLHIIVSSLIFMMIYITLQKLVNKPIYNELKSILIGLNIKNKLKRK